MNRLCCSALTLSLSSAVLAGEAPVQICLGEGNEWPPYTYWERQDGKIDQSRLTGAATTMVLDALQQLGLQHRVATGAPGLRLPKSTHLRLCRHEGVPPRSDRPLGGEARKRPPWTRALARIGDGCRNYRCRGGAAARLECGLRGVAHGVEVHDGLTQYPMAM